MSPAITAEESRFVARRVLAMLRDPRSNAERLGRILDTVERLAWRVRDEADHKYAGRGRAKSTAHAVTLLGLGRVEAITRRFLDSQHAIVEYQQPEERAWRGQPEWRYAAV